MRTFTCCILTAVLTACAAGGEDDDASGGSGGVPTNEASNHTASTTGPGNGSTASTGTTGNSECVLDTPCASDLQCTAIAGTACNDELTPPRCQRLACEGQAPCDGRDEFCDVDRNCRVADHATGFLCLPRATTAQDCMTSCTTAPGDPATCDGGGPVSPSQLCAQVCASDVCLSYEGIKYVALVSECGFDGASFDIECVDGASLSRWFYGN